MHHVLATAFQAEITVIPFRVAEIQSPGQMRPPVPLPTGRQDAGRAATTSSSFSSLERPVAEDDN
jgi:hypothetical protein